MNPKSTKILKLSLTILGAILILISSTLTVATMDFQGNPYIPKYLHKSYVGTDTPFWSLDVVGGAILFLLSHFRNSLLFKIGYYVVLAFVLFLTVIFTLTFATDINGYVNNLAHGYYIQQIGFSLVVVGTLISLNRKVVKTLTDYDKLLDSEL